jgi:uncharacterized membrane protein
MKEQSAPISTSVCAVCGQAKPSHELTPADLVRPTLHDAIRRDHPEWNSQSWICHFDLHRYTGQLIEDMLTEERGELTRLDVEVVASLRENEISAENINEKLAEQNTVGERLADQISEFGGSWRFVMVFVGLLALWVVANTWAIFGARVDPYPFIFLNLVLSCIAALQAPIIMMSQNRQERRDRLRADQDYKVNLKAELEVRLLTAKLDQLRNQQWQRLLEIQKIQTNLMQEILNQRDQVTIVAGSESSGDVTDRGRSGA